MRVLIVDDVSDVADATSYLLEDVEKTWQVRTAYGSSEGIEAAIEFQPDAVVLDLMMPVIDGFEVARRLRGLFGDRLTIIGFTGSARVPAERATLSGIDHVVLKPYEIDELVGVLKRLAAAQEGAALRVAPRP